MKPVALPKFEREYKKLIKKVQERTKEEIKFILTNPEVGEPKKGDLSSIRIHKFKYERQLYLLAYEVDYNEHKLYLYTIGTHEGFYKRLKKYLKVM